MTENKKNILAFYRGLFTGLMLGAFIVYFIFRLNIPVIEKIRYISIPYKAITEHIFSSGKETSETLSKKQDSENIKLNEKLPKVKTKAESENDTIAGRIKSEKNNSDSTISDKKFKGNSDEDNENIVVMKDELISVKQVPVDDKETDQANKEEQKLSEVLTDNNQSIKRNIIIVEFWKSPVNYVGYRMADNKLVIYGIDDIEQARFFFYNKDFYVFENPDKYFHLENNEKFMPLVKLTNVSLINHLQQISNK